MTTYDEQYPETGSSNISKATPEWTDKLQAARTQATSGEFPLHLAYQLINEEVKTGIPWNKCQNCGSPYKLTTDGATDTHCSSSCYSEAVADLHSSSEYDYFEYEEYQW